MASSALLDVRRDTVACAAAAPSLSIAIVSYRRADDLMLCLEDLAAQRTDVAFEVVLVLQAYPAGVADEITRTFDHRLTLQIHEFETGLGVHGARNAALEVVRAPIVAFFDDDIRLESDWVETLMPYFDDPTVGGVGGYVANPGCRRLSVRLLRPMLGLASRRYRVDWGGFHTLPWSSHSEMDQPADWLSGGNMAYRVGALAQVGKFDESFGHYGYDDVDMGVRVRRVGWKLLTTKRLAVVHNPSPVNRPSLTDFVRDEEARRVLLVRKAIGHLPRWRQRYLLRFSLHFVATLVMGLRRGKPQLALSAAQGARRGLALYGA
ncbi:MAG TPA: glycosyltransferase [Gemmatimonadaceae bacterium]